MLSLFADTKPKFLFDDYFEYFDMYVFAFVKNIDFCPTKAHFNH